MSQSTDLFLGAIALAAMLIAVVHIGVIIVLIAVARRVLRLVNQIEQEITPLFATIHGIARELGRASSLAVAQISRADHLLSDLGRRAEQTIGLVQNAVLTPAREGMALLAGLRAGLAAFQKLRENSRRRRRAEDEDALFIG